MKYWMGWFGVGLVLAACLNAGWWLVLAKPLESQTTTDTVIIPDGTASAIASGEPFLFAPGRISVPAGGQLRVVNRDSVAHMVGSTAIPPGATATIEALESGELSCTIHPQGHLDINLGSSPPVLGMAIVSCGACIATLVAGSVLRTSVS